MFTRQFVRKLTTASGSPKKESTFMRVWVKEYAAWPLIFFTSAVVLLGTLATFHSLKSPDVHLNKGERKTIDFLENEREQKSAHWGESKIHRGPEFIREQSPYKHYENIKPSDEK